MKSVELSCKVNGRPVSLPVEPDTMLVDFLRGHLGLTGTKTGCREGECGTCTVLLDGMPVNSCILPALKAAGREITTIEGLARPDGSLDDIQEAFMDAGAIQCGYCSPGMMLTAKSLLEKNPNPSEDEIKHALSGVLCRCTGYRKIVQAVRDASCRK
ncbi:(2Fe-2S)-binding protein [Desulfocarbo indianensis]|nr:(2Fe-2S)-binding protein [Desulfocarbo indianensis]